MYGGGGFPAEGQDGGRVAAVPGHQGPSQRKEPDLMGSLGLDRGCLSGNHGPGAESPLHVLRGIPPTPAHCMSSRGYPMPGTRLGATMWMGSCPCGGQEGAPRERGTQDREVPGASRGRGLGEWRRHEGRGRGWEWGRGAGGKGEGAAPSIPPRPADLIISGVLQININNPVTEGVWDNLIKRAPFGLPWWRSG